MPADHILVLAVDGLRAAALGAYGNTSFPTPALDRLAAESFLFDGCFAEATELPLVYRALWQGLHPLRGGASGQGRPKLAALLAAKRYATTLVTDEPDVVSLGSPDFERCVEVANARTERADDVSQTALAQLFAAACEAIEDSPNPPEDNRPQLLWIHSRGMLGPWDAPLELQAPMLDEDDPPPREAIEPPEISINEADDPDTAFVCGCAYAAQVMVLDACVEALVAAAEEALSNRPWTLVLLGTRGFPLGEHRQVGGVDPRLYVEQLHVPLLLRTADGAGRLARGGQLVSHIDLLPTLLALSGSAESIDALDGMSLLPLLGDPGAPWRDAVLSATSFGDKAIRTAEWSLVERGEGRAESDDLDVVSELYVRPDDRWEANNVAQLCRAEVDMLSAVANERARRLAEGEPIGPQWLPEGPRATSV